MRNKFKKIGLLSLSLLLCGCVSKNSNDNALVECYLVNKYDGEFEAGKPIDIEWFFYSSNKSKTSTTVTYTKNKNEVTEDVVGNIFYPSVTGKHVFKFTCLDKTLTKEIEVLDEQPILTIDKSAFFTGASEEVYFFDIYNEISYTAIPSSADMVVDKVEWSPFDFTLGGSEPVYTEVSHTQKYFDGSKQGKYRISVSLVNGKRSAQGEFFAYITNKAIDGNKNVLQVDGVYASNKVVVDSTNDNRFILPSSPFRTASYIVLNKTYANKEKVGVKFKGKQIPSFGMFIQPNATNGSFSPFSIDEGYVLSFEQRATHTYTVYGYSQEWKRAYQPQYEFGLDNLDNNKYYYFEYSFGSYPSTNPSYKWLHDVHWWMYEIEDYGTDHENLKKVFEIDGAGGWFDNHEVPENTYMSLYSSSLQDIAIELVL